MVKVAEDEAVEEGEVATQPQPNTHQPTLGGRPLGMPTCPPSAHVNVTGNLESQVSYVWNPLHALGGTTSNQKLKIEGPTNSIRRKIVTTDFCTVFCITNKNRKYRT